MPGIAINGYGRIGRNILRSLFERNLDNHFLILIYSNANCKLYPALTKALRVKFAAL